MNVKKEIVSVALTALLHDIGKLYQRTGEKIDYEEYYSSYIKQDGSYKHAAFTSKFINECLPNLNFLSSDAASHHQIQSIYSTADHYASSHDRKSDLIEDDEISQGKYDFILKRLSSIFNEVSMNGLSVLKPQYFDLQPLDKLTLIDGEKEQNLLIAKEKYKKLCNELMSKCRVIDDDDIEIIHHRLYPIIKQYTTSVPSATYQKNDPNFKSSVSLFEHLKLTGAIATILHHEDYHYGVEGQENKMVFLEYDLSGTQDYIFQVTEGIDTKKGVAKALRTRSFFLSVLTDMIGYKILNQFNLPYENMLMSAGGRGVLMLPMIDEYQESIAKVIHEIEQGIFEKFKGKISFSFSENICDIEKLHDEYDKLLDPNNKAYLISKKQKFKSIFNEKMQFILPPIKKACKLCGIYESYDDILCEDCRFFEKLNTILVNNSKFVIEYDFSHKSLLKEFTIAHIGTFRIHEILPQVSPNSYYVTINGFELGESKFYANSNANNNTFHEIANYSQGDKKLAVIKMDVDNLGSIFGYGIRSEYKTFSKILALSRNIDYFFTKRINDFLIEKYANQVYVNYSGGDDMVLIAPASDALEIIKQIYDLFDSFVGFNKNLHISTGIDIFDDKSPIRYAVLRADDALHQSKLLQDKNATTIFDTSISNSSLHMIINEYSYYLDALINGNMSRGVLYKLYSAIDISLENEKATEFFMRYIPQISYSLERNIENLPFRQKLKKIFVCRDVEYTTLLKYKIIFQYSLLLSRKEK